MQSRKQRGGYLIIAGILLVGGIWYWRWQIIQKSAGQENIIQDTALKQRQTPQALDQNETSNWKTYSNEQYGFEIQYPDGWNYNTPSQLGLHDEQLRFYGTSTGNFFIDFWSGSQTLDEYMKKYSADSSATKERRIIKDLPGYTATITYGIDRTPVQEINFIKKGDTIYMIGFLLPFSSDTLKNQILSSFKFIK